MNNNFDIHQVNKTDVTPADVFVISFPLGEYPADVAQWILESFHDCFPDNKCMLIPDKCNIEIYGEKAIIAHQSFEPASPEELYDFLNINKHERIVYSGQ